MESSTKVQALLLLNLTSDVLGWNDASKIAILCKFIDDNHLSESFGDFLDKVEAEESSAIIF